MIAQPADGDYPGAFVRQFRREYGFELRERSVVVDDVRVRGAGRTNILRDHAVDKAEGEAVAEAMDHRCFFDRGWERTPVRREGGGGGSAFYRTGADGALRQVYMLERLGFGHKLAGPAIIMNGSSTVRAPFPRHPSPPSCAQEWAGGGGADRYRAWMRR